MRLWHKDLIKALPRQQFLSKEKEEEEKIMCKEHDIKEITKKLKELEERLESLKKEPSPYDRVEYAKRYYHINNYLQVTENIDMRYDNDNIRHSCANYMDEKNAIRKSKEMQLNFLLDRFTRENGWDDKFWGDTSRVKYSIVYDYDSNTLSPTYSFMVRDMSQVYFVSIKIAQEAIEKYKDLFLEVFKPNEVTKEEFDKSYVGERMAVWCPTEELANEFLKKADEFGYEWHSSHKYTDRNFYDHSNTCYCIYTGMFCSKQEYLNNRYTIVTFEGF